MKFIIIPGLALMLLSLSCSQSEVKYEKHPISPFLFGQNLWLTDGAEGRPGYIQEHLWPKIEASGVKMVRIGGHGYDVSLPGIDTLETWVKSIKEIGAEPLFQVSRYESIEKAVELVRYFNIENEYAVRYWAIGNEPYQIGKLSIDSISSYIKSFASAMKEIDPAIKIFMPDAAAYYLDLHGQLLLDNRNSVAGRDENGHWYIDGIAFHNYPNSKDYTRSDVIFYSVSKMRGMIMDLVSDLEKANQKYERRGEDKLLWGLTEFNITYSNPDDHSVEGIAVPSFINGQFWADIFALAMEYDGFTVTPWCIQESDRPSTYFGYVGSPPDYIPHSTYYHMQLMANNFKGNFVKMNTNNPYLKAFASLSEGGSAVMLMNQDQYEKFDFVLDQSNTGASDGLTISAATSISANYSGSIGPNTTLLLTFNKAGKLLKHLEYDLELAREQKAPRMIQ